MGRHRRWLRGRGRRTRGLLAQSGTHLVLMARKEGPLEATAERCRGLGVDVRTLALDLTDPASIEAIVEATADLEVGLLAYNAGANTHGRPFTEGTREGFGGVIDLNITAMLALVHHFAGPMKQRRRGGILLMGSLAGQVGTSSEAVYGGVKAFGQVFAEGQWVELKTYDVHARPRAGAGGDEDTRDGACGVEPSTCRACTCPSLPTWPARGSSTYGRRLADRAPHHAGADGE